MQREREHKKGQERRGDAHTRSRSRTQPLARSKKREWRERAGREEIETRETHEVGTWGRTLKTHAPGHSRTRNRARTHTHAEAQSGESAEVGAARSCPGEVKRDSEVGKKRGRDSLNTHKGEGTVLTHTHSRARGAFSKIGQGRGRGGWTARPRLAVCTPSQPPRKNPHSIKL